MELPMSKQAWRSGCGATLGMLLGVALLLSGCAPKPTFIADGSRRAIDRSVVEFPSGFAFKLAARNLTGANAIDWIDEEGSYQGSLLIAESGDGNTKPRIYGFKPDGTWFSVYPAPRRLPFGWLPQAETIYGPIGGMVVADDRIYVTHRDARGRGVVSSFGFDGSRATVVGDLPCEGDYSLTDIAIHPSTGKLWFGVGAATNSGVVGLDNWEVGWVHDHPSFCDLPALKLKIHGYRYFTKNPRAGFFGGDDNVGTAPFHPFGRRNLLTLPEAPNGRPTSAIYSVSPGGGDLAVEAHGIRLPRGIVFDEFGNPFATNNGMELRGTRPVKDDPDVLLKIIQNTWYGFPDFSASLLPISDKRFEPPPEILSRLEYPELAFLIDHSASALSPPDRQTLLLGSFPSQSGAAKLDLVPAAPGFNPFLGNALVAQFGDRAPFATGGQRLKEPVGGKVLRVDLVAKEVSEFIRNTRGTPASKQGKNVVALERPIDVKFGPDKKLYILDYGQMEMRDGRQVPEPGTGRIFILEPLEPPTAAK
jgi:hypothetical protein